MSAVRRLEELLEEELKKSSKKSKQMPSNTYFRKSSIEGPSTTISLAEISRRRSSDTPYDPSLDQAKNEQKPSAKGAGGQTNHPSTKGPFKTADESTPLDKGTDTRVQTRPFEVKQDGKETYPFGGGAMATLPEPGSRAADQPRVPGKYYLKERPEATAKAKALAERFGNPIFTDNYFGEYLSRDNEQTNFTLSLPPSSTIQSANYYPDSNRLEVSFKSGETYTYDSVPFELVAQWQKASSAGSFFYHNIRMNFRYYSSARSSA